jgi:calcium-dependent protein kinase
VPDAPFAATLVQRLQRYGTYGSLKRAALRKLAHELESGARGGPATRGLRALFAELDSEGSGRVTAAQLRHALEVRETHYH